MNDSSKRRWFSYTVLLFFLIALIPIKTYSFDIVPPPVEELDEYIVRGLDVRDIPDDNGTGVYVTWEPLKPEARIIEYRVYRGTDKDRLFYIGSIPSNPETGFAGDRVYYHDSGYNLMTNVNSPRSLRKEVQQPEDSPLYREIPRDLTVTAHKFDEYSVLGVIPKKHYYYNARKIELPGEREDETNYYAGLFDRQMEQVLMQLKPDNTYYYTVIAVDQARRFYPHAPIVEGIPRINSPEKPRRLSIAFLEDIDLIQFEYLRPFTTAGIGSVNYYLLRKEDAPVFQEFVEQVERAEENRLERLEDPEIEPYQPTIQNPAQLLHTQPILTPNFTDRNKAALEISDNRIVDPEGNVIVNLDQETLDDYYALISLNNRWQMETFGSPAEIQKAAQQDLPPKPDFVARDRPNCEGDHNLLYWDKPVAIVMDTSFLNRDRTRLRINYEYHTNEKYKIDNIYFDIYDDEGNLITQINEFYQDLFFNITLPDRYRYDPGAPEDYGDLPIKIEMSFRTSRNELAEDYVFKQELAFDEDYMAYRPRTLYLRNDPIEQFSYEIYRKSYSEETFRLTSRISGIVREQEDMIRYIENIFRPIQKVLPEDQLLLVGTRIDAMYDKERRMPVMTHIFYSLVEQEMEEHRQAVESLTARLEEAETDEERQALQLQLEQHQLQLALNEHEFMQKANDQPSDRARMQMIAQRREREARTYQYKMITTDGSGLFVETDVYEDEIGNTYFFPQPNWFETDMYVTLVATLLFGFFVWFWVRRAKQGKEMYIRPIAGIEEIDNAIGRATEMGRPIMFNPGLDGISRVPTLAGLAILGRVAKKAAEYDTKMIVPCRDFIVTPIAQEIVREAHYEAGRPDTFDKNSVFFLTSQQFAFVAGVSGIMVREKCSTCFYMGAYYAEALIMTEVGNTIGAIQIAGSDSLTQIPFFITTCDYTIIGEELYGAAAYLGRDPMIMATLKATDTMKILILISLIGGTFLSTIQQTFFIEMFPSE